MDTIKNRKGSALIVAILSLAVILILSTTMVSISSGNFEMSHAERRYQAAYYVAEAGIRHQIEHMRQLFESLHARTPPHNNADSFFSAFNTQLTNQTLTLQNLGSDTATAIITITNTATKPKPISGNPRTYFFTSRATVGNVRRTIEGSVTLQWSMMQPPPVFFNHAIFSDREIDIGSHSEIVGNVGSNVTVTGGIDLGSHARIVGDVFYGKGGTSATVRLGSHSRVTGQIRENPATLTLPAFDPPDGLALRGSLNIENHASRTISQSGRYTSIALRNHSKLTFDLTSNDLQIVVDDDFIVENHAQVVLQGNRRLYLFVTDRLLTQNHVNFNSSSGTATANQLLIFVGGNVEIRNHADVIAGIYAFNPARSDTYLEIGSHATVTGAIIARRIDIRGSHARIVEFSPITSGGFEQYLPTPNHIPPERMFIIHPWQEQ